MNQDHHRASYAHTVHFVENDPGWASFFENEADAIRHAGGALILDVQHVGSTAVFGLPAKPIVDIALAAQEHQAFLVTGDPEFKPLEGDGLMKVEWLWHH